MLAHLHPPAAGTSHRHQHTVRTTQHTAGHQPANSAPLDWRLQAKQALKNLVTRMKLTMNGRDFGLWDYE